AFAFRFLALLAAVFVALASAVRAEGPPLWRVKTDAGEQAYLFGSIHLLPEDTHWRTPLFTAAFRSVDRLILEVDTDGLDEFSLLNAVRDVGFFPPGQSLADLLGEEEYAEVMRAGESLGVPELALRQFRPWYASILLATRVLDLEGATARDGVESLLAADARTRKIDIGGLETLDQQMAFFAELRRETQIALLMQTVIDIQTQPQAMDALTEAWLSGDLGRMETTFVEPLEAFPDLYDGLLTRRNKAWARQIKRLMRQGDELFFAVGAAHLVGEHSLIVYLRERGLEVERLN
ncbi:MAG: TraB/GumN family protein, partial [Pseudomonadota bacterium]